MPKNPFATTLASVFLGKGSYQETRKILKCLEVLVLANLLLLGSLSPNGKEFLDRKL